MIAKAFALCNAKMPAITMKYHLQKFVMVHAINVLLVAKVHALKKKKMSRIIDL